MATKKSKKEADPNLTLAQLSELYAAQMEREGKSAGTRASYAAELTLAQTVLGAETLIANLTPNDITRFESHDRVTRLRSGKPKSQLSIDKTRRVLRLAFAWATTAGVIANSPYAPAPDPTEPPKPTRKKRGVELVVSQDEAEAAADVAEAAIKASTPEA